MDGIDKLNNLESEKEYVVIDKDEFFREMDLTKAQIQERIDFAEETEDLIFFIYAYIVEMYERDAVNYDRAKRELVEGYQNIIEEYVPSDKGLRAYTERFANEVINTTQRRLNAEISKPDSVLDEVLDNSYWLSDARATETAVNMALDVINYKDFVTAKERGFTRKQWLAIEDNRTRPTHSMVNTRIIPIDEYFEVGAARLAFPHDLVTDGSTGIDHLEEIANCRCSFRYVR